MKIQDDRAPEEKITHFIIVVGTDSFMSGWGEAKGGVSYAGWACTPEQYDRVLNWVSNRSEMKRVRIVGNSWRPKGIGHTHIYVVHDNHPALK
jgi:hypothetical protein